MKKFQFVLITFFSLLVFSHSSHAYVIVPEGCRGENLDQCLYQSKMEYIFIYEEITSEEKEFFKKLDEEWDEIQPLPPIYVESIGGSRDAAVFVGEVLRKRHATVYTGNPITRLDRAMCVSACVFIAAGAERRFLSGMGVHSGVYVEDLGRKGEIITEIKDGTELDVLEYLRNMKIDDEVFNLIKATPARLVHYIYYVPELPLKKQLIHRLGFRMIPTADEKRNLLERVNIVAPDDHYARVVVAALYGSVGAVRELIRKNISIANGRTPNFERAKYWSEYGVKLGDPKIIHNYAVALSNGYYGQKDEARAVDLYSKAAQLGLGPSQNNLGWHLYKGEGVSRDIPSAVFWITQAASRDNHFAYGSLCEMHGAGDVFPRDDLEAFKWCELALLNMEAGSAREASEAVMAQLTARMTDRQIDEASKRVKNWKPEKSENQMKNKEDW